MRRALHLVVAFGLFTPLFGQQQATSRQAGNIFVDAHINMDKYGRSPLRIRLPEGQDVPVPLFFEEYKRVFGLSDDNEFKTFEVWRDRIGQTHRRIKQYYKGIELAEVQYLLHEKDGSVFYAHGKFIHGLDLDIVPVLSEKEALQFALAHVDAQSYMWEKPENEAFLKKEQDDPSATFYPKGELKISAGYHKLIRKNLRLVYRFDIYVLRPLGRWQVDIDAKTGELVGSTPRLYTGDVQGEGLTLYNGLVPITVSDGDFPSSPHRPPAWHLDTWKARGGSGGSWWAADPSLGNEGGYANNWYEVLDTDPISLVGTDIKLSFFHRYAVEEPSGSSVPDSYIHDGFDGMNVQISTDSGRTWKVLALPSPPYNSRNLLSFDSYAEGPAIPGWTDCLEPWIEATFDLSAFAGETARLRFAFASDVRISTDDDAPELFGWQIDDIVVSSSAGILFRNEGTALGMTARNLVKEVTLIPGNYRLREAGRGVGISTYEMRDGSSYLKSIDFIDEDSSFVDADDHAGVSAHWAAEAAYDYFLIAHGRNSFDDAGERTLSYVQTRGGLNNAFWDGERMVFGHGDGLKYGPLVSVDVVGHEFTHGITGRTCGLIYANEPGALNESFSDIFGALVEFSVEGSNGDWILGEDFAISGPAVRSLADPKSLGSPDTYMGDYWVASAYDPRPQNDFGGVHTNSGVQDYWFHLLSEGGSGVNDNGDVYEVAGIGLENAAQVAYRNLTVYLRPSSGYFDARLASINSAIDLFGANSPQLQSVIDAWAAVGVERPYLDATAAVSSDTLDLLAEVGVETDSGVVTISNLGLETLTIEAIEGTGPSFGFETSVGFPVRLSYDETIAVSVTFTPTSEGEGIGTLAVVTDDPNEPVKFVALRGYGLIVHPAEADVVYAVSSYAVAGEAALLTIDSRVGRGNVVGTAGFRELTGLTIRPSDGELYATVGGPRSSLLVRIDASSGVSSVVSTMPIANMRAIAYDLNDNLYGASIRDGNLYSIDPSTGDATLVGTTGLTALSGLAVNPVDGELWGTTAVDDAIYEIDKTTARVTLVGHSGLGPTSEIAFDAEGQLLGLLSGFGPDASELLRIDPTTGVGSRVGSTTFKFVYGLATRGAIATDVNSYADKRMPEQFDLFQNYPNPFNPSTNIQYDLPERAHVTLIVYDVLGRQVRTLVNATQASGHKRVQWDGRDNHGRQLASGVYLYHLQAGTFEATRKVMILK